MFETIKNFFVNNWKKLLAAIAAAVLSFFLLKYVLAPFLSLTVVATVGAVAVGYLVFTRVALWEIQALAKKAGIDI
jgi:hypothetical protein